MSETKKITPEDVKRYIRTGGSFCLFCGSAAISADTVRSECESAWQDVTCENCGEEWKDVFYLAQVERVRGEPLCPEYSPQLREDGSVDVPPAPELLEACIKLTEFLSDPAITDWINRSGIQTDRYGKVVLEARAVIAKAKVNP